MSNNIDNRSSFFPGNKAQYTKAPKRLEDTVLKRNDEDRKKELEKISARDSKVDISNAIKDFSRIKKAVDASPEIDNSAKVELLKKRISSGNYQVDYEALADKILSSEF